jgi:hypothetical protein
MLSSLMSKIDEIMLAYTRLRAHSQLDSPEPFVADDKIQGEELNQIPSPL